jgi:hypothetical protein
MMCAYFCINYVHKAAYIAMHKLSTNYVHKATCLAMHESGSGECGPYLCEALVHAL